MLYPARFFCFLLEMLGMLCYNYCIFVNFFIFYGVFRPFWRIKMENIRIQDDLYTHVNQETLDKLVIPDDMPSIGGFATLATEIRELMMGEFAKMSKDGKYPNDYLKRACTLYKTNGIHTYFDHTDNGVFGGRVFGIYTEFILCSCIKIRNAR